MAKKQVVSLTREELIAELPEIRKEIDAAIDKLNAVKAVDEFNKIKKDIDEKKAQYNGYAQDLCILDCKESSDSVVSALQEICRRRKYDGISVRSQTDESGNKTWSVEDTRNLIDLTKTWGTKEQPTALSAPWRYRAELMCVFATKSVAAEIGKTDKEYLADLARFFKLSKEAAEAKQPSNRSMLTVIKECVSAIIGEEAGNKVTSHDVAAFKSKFTQDDAKESDTIVCGNVRKTVKILVDICHRIMTDGSFQIKTKQLSKEGRAWQEAYLNKAHAVDLLKSLPESEQKALMEKLESEKSGSASPAESAPVSEEKPKEKAKAKSAK